MVGGTDASPKKASPPHARIALSRQMSGAKRSGCPTSRTCPISASAKNGFSRNAPDFFATRRAFSSAMRAIPLSVEATYPRPRTRPRPPSCTSASQPSTRGRRRNGHEHVPAENGRSDRGKQIATAIALPITLRTISRDRRGRRAQGDRDWPPMIGAAWCKLSRRGPRPRTRRLLRRRQRHRLSQAPTFSPSFHAIIRFRGNVPPHLRGVKMQPQM